MIELLAQIQVEILQLVDTEQDLGRNVFKSMALCVGMIDLHL